MWHDADTLVLIVPGETVRRDVRRTGLGGRLLRALQRANPSSEMRIINADASDAGFGAFLERVGARHSVDQIELALDLQ